MLSVLELDKLKLDHAEVAADHLKRSFVISIFPLLWKNTKR